MECPGLNGPWLACPPTIDGLTVVELDVFRSLVVPLGAAALVVLLALMTLVVLVASEGLAVGPRAGALPRDADLVGALRHARELRRSGAHRANPPRRFPLHGPPAPASSHTPLPGPTPRRLDPAA